MNELNVCKCNRGANIDELCGEWVMQTLLKGKLAKLMEKEVKKCNVWLMAGSGNGLMTNKFDEKLMVSVKVVV